MPSQLARPVEFTGAGGLTLRGDELGDPSAPPVVLLHGGGQTRHSWTDTASALNEDGWRVITLDQRGHGDSDWAPDQEYRFTDFADDLLHVVPALGMRPVLVGASLGGLASMLAESLSEAPFS